MSIRYFVTGSKDEMLAYINRMDAEVARMPALWVEHNGDLQAIHEATGISIDHLRAWATDVGHIVGLET